MCEPCFLHGIVTISIANERQLARKVARQKIQRKSSHLTHTDTRNGKNEKKVPTGLKKVTYL